ncbi:MAG: SDR family oxidoreductase [Thermodesulfobacteriota bacterium]|jgi:3-oxoacyl-[acyl-carrier protein] reductase
MNKSLIKDKVVIVTGASKGIGLATSLLLVEKGAQVILAARNKEALEKACDLIEAKSGSCIPIPTDVRQENEVKSLIAQVVDRYGRIDVLINNAGVLVYGPMVSTTSADWDKVIDTNLKGAFLCSREVLSIMLKQGHGQIINLASGAGKGGFPNLTVYCASKFGLVGLTEALSQEVVATNIKIAYLCPGYVDTEMLSLFPRDFLKDISPVRPKEVADQILRIILNSELTEGRKRFLKSLIKKGVQWLTWRKLG